MLILLNPLCVFISLGNQSTQHIRTMTFWDYFLYSILFLAGGLLLYLILVITLLTMGLRNKFAPPVKPTSMHDRIFDRVVIILRRYARYFKITYYAVNIILYFFLVPFTWLILLDLLFDFHYLKIAFVLFCIVFAFYCKDFEAFSLSLYKRSVQFLNYFNRFGSNYVVSSVWICVAVPLLIYALLLFLVLR